MSKFVERFGPELLIEARKELNRKNLHLPLTRVAPNQLSVRVKGGKTGNDDCAQVRFSGDGTELIAESCTCTRNRAKFGEPSNERTCKHVVALLLAFEDDPASVIAQAAGSTIKPVKPGKPEIPPKPGKPGASGVADLRTHPMLSKKTVSGQTTQTKPLVLGTGVTLPAVKPRTSNNNSGKKMQKPKFPCATTLPNTSVSEQTSQSDKLISLVEGLSIPQSTQVAEAQKPLPEKGARTR